MPLTLKRLMPVTIKAVTPDKRHLKPYVQFAIDLYKDNPCYVPPLVFDEINTLRPDKNPAFEFCKAQSFMAFKDGKPAGRITAIINTRANRKNGKNILRFGFVDFIDDAQVVDALFKAAADWGRRRGMDRMVGPMGFSDLDQEGMLVEGFDQTGTMATIYNHPYYMRHMQRMGFEKEADWVEYRITVPPAVPDKFARVADIARRRFDLHIVPLTNRKKLKQQYGQAIFDLINDAYSDLYGYVALTQKQIDYYIEMYLGMLRLDCLCLIADAGDRLVGVGLSMPSLSHALQKSRGRLWPLGWYRLLRALHGKADVVDLLLVAVARQYQGKGVNALLFSHLVPSFIKNGFEFAESNVELEGNENVQRQWDLFERRQHRRRRAWGKKI